MKFERYSEYKDSGINWLGDIPSDWNFDRLINLATYNDNSLNVDIKNNETFISYIDIGNVSTGSINNYAQYSITNLPSRARRIVRTGDVIFSTVRVYLKAITIINKEYDNFVVSTGFIVIRPRYMINKFSEYCLISNIFVNLVESYSFGVSYPAINANTLIKFSIPYPSSNTQTKIANYLDTQTAKIDKKIALLEQKIQKYQELKQTLINETVLRGLDKTTPLKDSGIEWIGNIPQHWQIERLKNIFNERVCKNLDRKTNKEVTNNILSVMKDIGVINHKDKGNVGNKMAQDISNYKLVYPDDIVVNKMNIMIGSVGISKEFGALSVIYIILTTKKNGCAKYYDYLFKIKSFQRNLRRISTGILEIREAVNMVLFMQERMVQPTPKEQTKIANYLDEKTSKIDAIIKTIQAQITHLTEFRKTLINDAVTGKIKIA